MTLHSSSNQSGPVLHLVAVYIHTYNGYHINNPDREIGKHGSLRSQVQTLDPSSESIILHRSHQIIYPLQRLQYYICDPSLTLSTHSLATTNTTPPPPSFFLPPNSLPHFRGDPAPSPFQVVFHSHPSPDNKNLGRGLTANC